MVYQKIRPTVVITRPAEQAGEFVDALTSAGFGTIELPAVRIERMALTESMRSELAKLAGGQFDWLLFTSVNGVRSLEAMLAEMGLSLPASGLKIAVQGERTARACNELLDRKPDFMPRSSVSEEFLAEFRQMVTAESAILFPHAAETRGVMVAGLSGHVKELSSMAVYKTCAIDRFPAEILGELAESPALLFSFFSPSAVRSVHAALGNHGDLLRRHPNCSIGPVTSAALLEVGASVDLESEKQSAADLAAAIVARYGELPL